MVVDNFGEGLKEVALIMFGMFFILEQMLSSASDRQTWWVITLDLWLLAQYTVCDLFLPLAVQVLVSLALRKAASVLYIFNPLPVFPEEFHYTVKKTKTFYPR